MEELTSERPSDSEAQVPSGHLNPEDDGSVLCASGQEGFESAQYGLWPGVPSGAGPGTKQAPRNNSVSFTELRKRLSVASGLPQNHSQQQEGPGQGF